MSLSNIYFQICVYSIKTYLYIIVYNVNMIHQHLNVINLIQSLTEALELSNPGILRHHLGVTYITKRIGEYTDLNDNQMANLIYSALIHDIGASIEWNEKQQMIIEDDTREIFNHAFEGYDILSSSKFFKPLAPFIKAHHDRYSGNNPDGLEKEMIPFESRIIYLADRIDLSLDHTKNLFSQKETILKLIKNNEHFDPKLVELFFKISENQIIWDELENINQSDDFINEFKIQHPMNYPIEDLISIAEIFSKLVDLRSSFTARHSENVAKVAEYIAGKMNYDKDETKLFYLAGLLHDLGKLVVPNEIIDKQGPLSDDEYELVKMHSYYSEMVIKKVDGFEEIAKWLGEHHERLDGSGYPYQLKAKNIKTASRILQISDVFSALSEHRPYRISLSNDEVIHIMEDMNEQHQIDPNLFNLLKSNIDEMRNLIDIYLVDINENKNTEFLES